MWHLGTRISGVRSMDGLDHLRGLFLNNYGILGSKTPCDIATEQPHKLTTEIRKLVLPHKNALKINNLKIVRYLDIAE